MAIDSARHQHTAGTRANGAATNSTAAASQRVARQWVGGEWLESSRQAATIDPATGEPIGTFHDADIGQVEAAIAAADEVFRTSSWRSDSMRRAFALSRLAGEYARRFEEIVQTLCAENGKLYPEAAFEVSAAPRALQFAAGLAAHNFGRVTESRPGQQSMSIRQAAGVAGLIIPWNSPIYLLVRALAPALAAGCTAVIKLPATAAQSAALTAELIASVPEIPRGAVNIVVESGDAGARLLVDSARVAVVSFTGSTRTGRAIAKAAANNLKRVSLELGGKTPHLVFADADRTALLPVLEKSLTVFAGQFCMTGRRLLLQRDIADAVIEGYAGRLSEVRPGPASDPTSDMGPLINKAEVDRVDAVVSDAIGAGAKVIVRGGPVVDAPRGGGAFYRPTLLAVEDNSLPIVQEEIFGPVQTVQIFDTEAEAIELANSTPYGLSASVWSTDAARTVRVARGIDAGLISINGWANLAVQFEEGGFKSSGLGRLGGIGALDDFLEYKQITIDFAEETGVH